MNNKKCLGEAIKRLLLSLRLYLLLSEFDYENLNQNHIDSIWFNNLVDDGEIGDIIFVRIPEAKSRDVDMLLIQPIKEYGLEHNCKYLSILAKNNTDSSLPDHR